MAAAVTDVLRQKFIMQLVLINFLPLLAIAFFVVFVRLNTPYEASVTKLFRLIVSFILLLILVDSVDLYNMTFGTGVTLQTVSTALGYNLRLWTLLALMQIVMRYETFSRRQWLLILIPAILTLCISLSAFGSHLMFWYEGAEFHRGPLSLTPHIACLIYGLGMLAYSARLLSTASRRDEGVMVVTTILAMFAATAAETVFQIRGVLNGMITMAIAFYYLYMFIDHFKRDELTGVLNRASFNADVRKCAGRITALVSMDLNDLKKINDGQGHSAGDEAIRTIAEVTVNNLAKGCSVYRMGGDEFSILCVGLSEAEVAAMIERIHRDMEKTRFRCSAGYCMWKPGMDFQDVYDSADRKMYLEKQTEKERRQA